MPLSALSTVHSIAIDDYDYELPFERIAQQPSTPPEASRMLYYDGCQLADQHFYDLPHLLPHGSTLIANDTRVLHARIQMRNATGANIELFLLAPAPPYTMETALASHNGSTWQCLVGNAKRWKQDTANCHIATHCTLTAHRIATHNNGEATITFTWDTQAPFAQLLLQAGQIPIPPYLKRPSTQQDTHWYQTIFARIQGSVAAPTAGLHFSEPLLRALAQHDIHTQRITLHVGAGTFLPVKTERIGNHSMHTEQLQVSLDTLTALANAKGPLIPIGTTSLRTLESLYWLATLMQGNSHPTPPMHIPQWLPYLQSSSISRYQALDILIQFARQHQLQHIQASTSLMIAPGYQPRMADGLITNFHQPRSTLLLLVAAIIGDQWRTIYHHALQHEYQFLSYGDGMLLLPHV